MDKTSGNIVVVSNDITLFLLLLKDLVHKHFLSYMASP